MTRIILGLWISNKQRSTNYCMNKIFVKTTNVKNFIGLVENLINKQKNITKMGLFMVNRDLVNHKPLYGLLVNMMGYI